MVRIALRLCSFVLPMICVCDATDHPFDGDSSNEGQYVNQTMPQQQSSATGGWLKGMLSNPSQCSATPQCASGQCREGFGIGSKDCSLCEYGYFCCHDDGHTDDGSMCNVAVWNYGKCHCTVGYSTANESIERAAQAGAAGRLRGSTASSSGAEKEDGEMDVEEDDSSNESQYVNQTMPQQQSSAAGGWLKGMLSNPTKCSSNQQCLDAQCREGSGLGSKDCNLCEYGYLCCHEDGTKDDGTPCNFASWNDGKCHCTPGY